MAISLTDSAADRVRTYLEKPISQEVNIDTSTDFVNSVSNIGGLLGLFLGFSLLSGIEIVYSLLEYLVMVLGKKLASRRNW